MWSILTTITLLTKFSKFFRESLITQKVHFKTPCSFDQISAVSPLPLVDDLSCHNNASLLKNNQYANHANHRGGW